MAQRFIVPVNLTVMAEDAEQAVTFTGYLMEQTEGYGPFSARFKPEIGMPQLRDELRRGERITAEQEASVRAALAEFGQGRGDLFVEVEIGDER